MSGSACEAASRSRTEGLREDPHAKFDETESRKRGAAEDFEEAIGKRWRLQNPRQVEMIFKNREGDHGKLSLRRIQAWISKTLVNTQIEETHVETSGSSPRGGGDVECLRIGCGASESDQ